MRNKFFIILYRGKDFLPSQVASLVAEREVELRRCQLEEEAARFKAIETLPITTGESMSSSNVGTLSEFQTIAEPGREKSETEVQLVAEKERLEKELRDEQHSLYIVRYQLFFFPLSMFSAANERCFLTQSCSSRRRLKNHL